ncbi:MAG: M6 family metalloprotease domain-containing protein [Nitrospirae bacterium]|nr:M6 family metalloprotease domain-containing protein [Nitrospirota bacterium]
MIPKKHNALYILLLCFSIFSTPQQSHAVPAAPGLHTLKQADGSKISARQWGDENLHGWETQEGLSIVFDEAVKSWAYAEHTAVGDLVSSSRIAGKDSPVGIAKHLRPKGEALSRVHKREPSKALKARSSAPVTGVASEGGPSKVVPPTGTANIPVILVNFNNTSTTYSNTAFNTLLFGTGNFSMNDYYQEVSYGAFSVSAGPGGVAGWYQALNSHNYYGTDVGGSGNDQWPGDLVYEAVAAADAAGFDFAPYDQDGDCYVDVVNIVHQGTGQEAGGISTDIWSHSWSLSGAYYWVNSHHGAYTTNDACPGHPGQYIKVDDYVVQPEVLWGSQQTMGVFAHEYGHALGLPDLYDTDYTSNGVGDWSLMAGGSWNGNSGDRPAHMDAWSKYFLGWVTPVQVSGTMVNESVSQAAGSPDVYQLLLGSPSTAGEYFLVENRQQVGFDVGLPGAGLLIWHIDESKTSNDSECYPGGPSCVTQHYHVSLVQADNLWELEIGNTDSGDTGDPFPGSASRTAFSSASSPNSNLFNGSPSNVSVTAISASSSTMTATFTAPSNDTTAPVPGTVTPSNTEFGSFVDSPFDLTTHFTDNETTVTSCAYTINGSTWLSATVSGASPLFTCTKTGITATNGQTLTLNMRAVSGGGTGTATPVTRTMDSAAPVTSINTTAAWVNTSPVNVILSPSDGSGSGVSFTRYCLDTANTCTPATSGTAVNVVCGAGSSCTQYVRYFSSDNIGNAEVVKSGQIRQDLSAPTDGTLTASGFNKEILLNWEGVTDTGSGLNGTNTYTLVRNTGAYPNSQCTNGTQVYLGSNTAISDSGLTNGVTYYYRVCARDAAGNVSAGAVAMATPDTSTWKMARNSYHLLPEGWLLTAFAEGAGPFSVRLMVTDEASGYLVPSDQIQGLSANPLMITSAALDPDLTLVFDDVARTAYLLHDSAGSAVLTEVADIRAAVTGTPLLGAPASVLFGSVRSGTTKDSTAVVSNAGTGPLHISSVSSPSAPFTKVTDGCSSSTVAPSGTCSIVFRFAPTAATTYTGSFSINSDGGNATVPMQGTGTTDKN